MLILHIFGALKEKGEEDLEAWRLSRLLGKPSNSPELAIPHSTLLGVCKAISDLGEQLPMAFTLDVVAQLNGNLEKSLSGRPSS